MSTDAGVQHFQRGTTVQAEACGSGVWSHRAQSMVRKTVCWSIAIAIVVVISEPTFADVIFVRQDAEGEEDGSSWDDAFQNLHDALAVAVAGDEIWVAASTYLPADGPGDRDATFELVSGVGLYGGFAGTERRRDEGDPSANVTTLSGDLAGNDQPDFVGYEENVRQVVTGRDLDDDTVVSGFVIAGGNADFPGNTLLGGGGMYILNGSPRIGRCTFVANFAGEDEPSIGGFGGGLFIHGGEPLISHCRFVANRGMNGGALGLRQSDDNAPLRSTVTDCEFVDNFAEFQTGGAVWSALSNEITFIRCRFENNFAQFGGAIIDTLSDRFSVIDCTFRQNRSVVDAGTIWRINASGIQNPLPTIIDRCLFVDNECVRGNGGALRFANMKGLVTNSVFLSNHAGALGGAIATSPLLSRAADDLEVRDCLFSGNSSDLRGGALFSTRCQNLMIGNSTFSGNSAVDAGGGVSIELTSDGTPARVDNCVLWGNEVGGEMTASAQITGGAKVMRHNLIQGLVGPDGNGNIGEDPLFSDADGADEVVGTEDDDLHLTSESPAINAGNPEFDPASEQRDLDGHGRVLCGRVDMGAHEFGLGDWDCDREVDLSDFEGFFECLTGPDAGPVGEGCEAFDAEADADVDLADFTALQGVFGGR